MDRFEEMVRQALEQFNKIGRTLNDEEKDAYIKGLCHSLKTLAIEKCSNPFLLKELGSRGVAMRVDGRIRMSNEELDHWSKKLGDDELRKRIKKDAVAKMFVDTDYFDRQQIFFARGDIFTDITLTAIVIPNL